VENSFVALPLLSVSKRGGWRLWRLEVVGDFSGSRISKRGECEWLFVFFKGEC